MNRNAVILGTGSYVPDRVLTNEDLAETIDTSDEWIRSRTGIRERRIASGDQAASDLGIHSSREALKDAGISSEAIDLIIVATATPDMFFPSTACVLQDELGAPNCAAFDLSAACTGFIYALSMAQSQIVCGAVETVLVVGAETLSKVTNWEDRSTSVLFGDGASSVVLGNRPSENGAGFDSIYIKADGQYKDVLSIPGGGSREPATHDMLDRNRQYLTMDGSTVFKVAVRKMGEAATKAVNRAELTTDDIDWVICHQANLRIINAVQRRLELPEEKMIVNLDKYGNTSAASIGLALDEARRDGRIQPGDRSLMVAFGGGLTWGSCVVTHP